MMDVKLLIMNLYTSYRCITIKALQERDAQLNCWKALNVKQMYKVLTLH